jgi:hypothetical protein
MLFSAVRAAILRGSPRGSHLTGERAAFVPGMTLRLQQRVSPDERSDIRVFLHGFPHVAEPVTGRAFARAGCP